MVSLPLRHLPSKYNDLAPLARARPTSRPSSENRWRRYFNVGCAAVGRCWSGSLVSSLRLYSSYLTVYEIRAMGCSLWEQERAKRRSMGEFPGWFPNGCPQDAAEVNSTLYHGCVTNPATDEDFTPHARSEERRKQAMARDGGCMGFGGSVRSNAPLVRTRRLASANASST